MKRVNITTKDSCHFAECWELYESAFPENERRTLEYQIETMQRTSYHFDALVDGESLIGVIGWWDFDNIRYIEHLATLPSLRNGGWGKKILGAFKQESSTMILLEVEHPTDDITHRRIGFYEREGFTLNVHPYSHPPYIGDERVELLVMTYPSPISESGLLEFTQKMFPMVHFRQ
ncbi:MAG: GNAT family N-acetyltransferase [Rikenellaceae bacterium]